MSDFIREVDEDYRRDRVIKFLTRNQVPIALLVVAIVVGAGGWRWWMDSKLAAAQQENVRFVAAEDLATAGKSADAQAAFDAIAKTGPAGYALLARMRAAEDLAKSDPEGAAKAFDQIADEDAAAASIRDAARFRGALLRVDRLDPKAFEQRYGRFSLPGFAFHSSMRELLALTALKSGDDKGAERYLDDLMVDPGAPGALRNRAEAFRLLVNAGPAASISTQPPPATVTPVHAAAAAAPPPLMTNQGTAIPGLTLPDAAPPLAAAPPAPPSNATPPAPAAPH